MVNNKIQFGVVREDPQIEIDLIAKYALKSAVLIGSGGCTAFSIKANYPKMKLSLIEPNPAQIQLIEEKIRILKKNSPEESRKSIGTDKQHPLIESGNFESLFKMFREFIYEFVASKKELDSLVRQGSTRKWKTLFKNPYWKTAFDLYFSDSLLVSMFGPDAIQYAPQNSYPKYFRTHIEKGISRSDAATNYFLYHIFFGHYFPESKYLPLYLQKKLVNTRMTFHSCFADEFNDYQGFELVSLSNIFDWSDLHKVREVAHKVSRQMTKDSILIYRQINNSSNFKKEFEGFKWQPKLEKYFLKKDRSLFYSKICIGKKM